MRKLALSSSVSTDSGIRGHVVRKGIHASNVLVLYPVLVRAPLSLIVKTESDFGPREPVVNERS